MAGAKRSDERVRVWDNATPETKGALNGNVVTELCEMSSETRAGRAKRSGGKDVISLYERLRTVRDVRSAKLSGRADSRFLCNCGCQGTDD